MAQVLSGNSAKVVHISSWKTYLVGVLVLMLCVAGKESAQATTGVGSTDPKPYEVPKVKDADNNSNNGIETWIVAEETLPGAPIYIAPGVPVKNAMTFKSCANAQLSDCTVPGIPGPEFRLKVGDRVIVHYVNKLPASGLTPEANVSGIHWHGIELNNASDGTELTQAAVEPGGTFKYDFIVTRPGIFWYHPHHHSSTNQVFKGLYGSMIIEGNYEEHIRSLGRIPSEEETKTLMLSDITVCGGTNPGTYASGLPHVSGLPDGTWQANYSAHDFTQSPYILCDFDPIDANGVRTLGLYGPGDVPNIQEPSLTGRMSEGFTVLTNGVDVATSGQQHNVVAGQGLRLQIVNPSPVRHMRLRLTDAVGSQVLLYRIGGEGGVLNNAVLEGGDRAAGTATFDFNYDMGEILIPPAGRADVVAKIPDGAGAGDVLTLWQEDFQRVLGLYSWTPTVPVMYLNVTGTGGAYNIAPEAPLLAGTSWVVPSLASALLGNLDLGSNEDGSTNPLIQLTFSDNTGAFRASVDGIAMPRDFAGYGKDGMQTQGSPFYLKSSRHAGLNNTLELMVGNVTNAHHPLHLHGFSFQPMSLISDPTMLNEGSYTFPTEFRDVVDVPPFSTLTFRVTLDDRLTADMKKGGGLGRWLFHCHILPHATFGMMSELHVHKK